MKPLEDFPMDLAANLVSELGVEAMRQQQLLMTLNGGMQTPNGDDFGVWMTPPGVLGKAEPQDGFLAYRRNAAASAHRALEQAYPVLAQVLGEPSLRALARALWLACPPLRGDLGEWGAELPEFLSASDDSPDGGMPYLADLARLEWAVHQAGRAADVAATPRWGLHMLAECEPGELMLVLAPGLRALVTESPVVTIWQTHQAGGIEDSTQFDTARAALQAGLKESAWVWRQDWRVQVAAGPEEAVAFTADLLAGLSLGEALNRQPMLDFQAWLLHALGQGWVLGCDSVPTREPV
jgi:hypothetical protein